ncbi:unnamed protein product [Paramecium octaurelia]|uniref:WD40-repeat-containing domain n=1 Tax=Paramecium octaurelia TaxID=43137 RepID=A0A8S1YKG2_PAROT|nr:unnamed protein product [Paramecium octaurelia]
MSQISNVQCLEHFEQVQFLDLRQNILKGDRAKCCKCQLINPTYIEQAFQKWIQKTQDEIQYIYTEFQDYLNPLKLFQEQMRQTQKSFDQNCEHIINEIDYLIRGINYDKNQKIKYLQFFGENISLSILQEMAELMSEKAPILKQSKRDVQLYIKLKLIINFAKQVMIEQQNSVIQLVKQQQQAKEKIETFKDIYLQHKSQYQYTETKNIYNIKQFEVCRVITFNKDDSIMLAGSNSDIKVWNFNNGKVTENQTLTGHIDDVISLTFSLNQDLFISGGSWKDMKIIIWRKHNDLWKYTQIMDYHKGYVPQILLNKNDSELISCSSDQTIIVWKTSLNVWKLEQKLANHEGTIYGMSLNYSENYLVSCGKDKSVIVWKKQNNIWKYYQKITHDSYAFRITFVDDDSFLFQLNNEGFIRLYSNQSQEKFQESLEQRITVQDKEDPWLLFPAFYNVEKKLVIQKQNQFVNLIINQDNGTLNIVNTIQCESHQNNGALSKSGRFLAIWDSSPIMEGDGIIKIYEIVYSNRE